MKTSLSNQKVDTTTSLLLCKSIMGSSWACGSEQFFHLQCGETLGKQIHRNHLQLGYARPLRADKRPAL